MSNPALTDPDGDSQMTSEVLTPSTPPTQNFSLELSPPNSQGGVALPTASSTSMPTVAASASGANANGKRPLDSLDGIADAAATAIPDLTKTVGTVNGSAGGTGAGGNGGVERQVKVHTHAQSGYSWSRAEDAPGWLWNNRKAVDEAARAWETGIVGKERGGVLNRYGDPFDMADREAALMKTSSGMPSGLQA